MFCRHYYKCFHADATDKDRLTSYNGKAVTYDSDGNIENYDGWSFTWTGSELSGLKSADKTISYEYNSEGYRTKKTVGDVTTTYTLNGGQIQSETSGSNTIKYYYSSSGSPVYLTINGTAYTYEKNMQGDIIGLLDSDNNEVVTYTYDSWGKLLNIGGKLASSISVENPIRYRGYYYDTETGLYYLQSRYYNPEWGRFISQDDGSYHEDMTGAAGNLWGYADNNAVMNSDPTGHLVFIDLFGTEDDDNNYDLSYLDNMLNAVSDKPGRALLLYYLYGGGKELDITNNKSWTKYMENNMLLKCRIEVLVRQYALQVKRGCIKRFNITTSMEIENGESISGYQFLHGTNKLVGGFKIKGSIRKDSGGNVTAKLTYQWNDIMDPNPQYTTDTIKSFFAQFIPGARPKIYTIRITWSDTSVLNSRGIPIKGWLSMKKLQ